MIGTYIVRLKEEATERDREDLEQLLRSALQTYPVEIGNLPKRRRRQKKSDAQEPAT